MSGRWVGPRRSVVAYPVAVGLVAAMAAVRQLLDSFLQDHHPFVLFLCAVFLSTWFGGWRAGFLALVLGLLTADYLFVHPRGGIGMASVEHQVGMAVYFVVGSANIALIEGLRRTQAALRRARDDLERRVGQRTAELEATTGRLVEEAAARQAAEARFRRQAALVESSEDAIVGKDVDGVVTDWNAGAEHLFGYAAGEVVGRPAAVLVPPTRRAELARMTARLLRGEDVPPFETVRVHKDGREVPVSVRLSPIREDDRVVGISSITRDLGPTRHLQEQLRQSQKMEAIGQLAGGVAHDFNNLLTVIGGYSELLLETVGPGDPTREPVGEIRAAGERAAALTRQLLVFSRQQVLEPKVMDLNDAVRASEKMLGRLIGEDVKLTTALDPDLGRVKVDPGQVDQVIVNLAVNARDAMPTGGRLTIETADVELDDEYAATHPEVCPGRYVLLAVSDTGTGMDEATKVRIFEPFFTTKEVGKGTGLGLAVVHGFVKQSGGHVAVYSEPGHGTTFKIYLPVVDAPRSSGSALPVPAAIPRGEETILLVEDERAVRALAARALRAAGFTVLEASHGGEAVLLAERHAGPIHLLMSDVVMPEMGGRLLAERLTADRPETDVLFVSGYTDDAVVRHGVLEEEMAFLQKPFTPAAMLRKVREVLDRRSPRTLDVAS